MLSPEDLFLSEVRPGSGTPVAGREPGRIASPYKRGRLSLSCGYVLPMPGESLFRYGPTFQLAPAGRFDGATTAIDSQLLVVNLQLPFVRKSHEK